MAVRVHPWGGVSNKLAIPRWGLEAAAGEGQACAQCESQRPALNGPQVHVLGRDVNGLVALNLRYPTALGAIVGGLSLGLDCVCV